MGSGGTWRESEGALMSGIKAQWVTVGTMWLGQRKESQQHLKGV